MGTKSWHWLKFSNLEPVFAHRVSISLPAWLVGLVLRLGVNSPRESGLGSKRAHQHSPGLAEEAASA